MNDERGTMNNEKKIRRWAFIIHHSSFIISLLASGFWLLTSSPLQAATKIYLHNADSSVAGYLSADQTKGTAIKTSVTNTTSGGTNIQVTATAGGSAIKWLTEPLVSGVTIAGSATCNLWGLESNGQANASLRCRFFKYSGGSEGAQLWIAQAPGELTTSATVKSFAATPTSTAFAAGDRIAIYAYLENCSATSGCPTGTMGASRTVTVDYDAATTGADGDSYLQLTENVGFQIASAAPVALNASPAVAQNLAKNPAVALALACPVCVDVNYPNAASVALNLSPVATGDPHSPGQSGAAPVALNINPQAQANSSGSGGSSVNPPATVNLSCPVCVDVHYPNAGAVALNLNVGATANTPTASRSPAAALAIVPAVECCRTLSMNGISLGITPTVTSPRSLQEAVTASLALTPAGARTVGRNGPAAESLAFTTSASTLRTLNKAAAVNLSLVASPFTVQSTNSTVNVDASLHLVDGATAIGSLAYNVAAGLSLSPSATGFKSATRTAAVVLQATPTVGTPVRTLNLGVGTTLHGVTNVGASGAGSFSVGPPATLTMSATVTPSGSLHRGAAAGIGTNTFAAAFKAAMRDAAVGLAMTPGTSQSRTLHVEIAAALNVLPLPFAVRGGTTASEEVPAHLTFGTAASDQAALAKNWAAALAMAATATANKSVARSASVALAANVGMNVQAAHSDIIPRADLTIAVAATALVNSKARVVVITT